MAGAKNFRQIAVIVGTLVFIGDKERNGRACGDTLINAGKQTDGVGLLALGGCGPLAGLAAIQFGLHVGFGQFEARRAAVNDAAKAGPVGFAKSGQAQGAPKGVTGHHAPRAGQKIWFGAAVLAARIFSV